MFIQETTPTVTMFKETIYSRNHTMFKETIQETTLTVQETTSALKPHPLLKIA
jgi:hypothetical protein